MGINWPGRTEHPPSFYTFTNKADFDEYVKDNTDIYTAPLPSRILKGEVVLTKDAVATKGHTYNVVGAWIQIDQPAYTSKAGYYAASSWGFVANQRVGVRGVRMRAATWVHAANLRLKFLSEKGAVMDYKRMP